MWKFRTFAYHSVDIGKERTVRLEELTPGTSVLGVVPGSPVLLIAATAMGTDAYKIVYDVPGHGLSQQILMRASEPHLALVEARPTPYDADPKEFKLAAEALRIQTAAQTDPMLAVTSSDLEPLPHQLEAVYGHLLERVPLRFLLADDPGAGKTIMAGLFIKELHLRGGLDRCLIVTPGGLVEQWQDELLEKFGLRFPILSADDVAGAPPGETVFDQLPRAIARMDQLARSESLLAQLRQTTWDLVIVDEAHRMSARYAARREIKATKRYKLGQALRDTTQHMLLMTATPHAGKEEDFQLFLALLDADRFEGRYRSDVHSVGADQLMVRRIKEELLTFEGRALFPLRAAYTVPYALSAGETRLYNRVTEYVGKEFNRVDELRQAKDARGNTVGFALTVLQRRLASSPEAILRSLERRQQRLQQSLNEELSNASTRSKVRISNLDPASASDEYSAAEREEFEDEFVDAATASRSPEELRREIAVLEDLVRVARKVRASGTDRKWTELRGLIQTAPEICGPGGEPRKLIVFTEHRDTLRYLVERITELIGRSDAVVAIHGSVSRDERRATQLRFTTDPTCLVLVATDAAGEGINLQRSHLMVNYDLPWNPNRIEQRFGRIHRIGQTEMCHLWNLVAADTREGAVFKRLLDKITEMNKSLGDKVFDVLGEAFEGQPLHELLIQAVRYGERPEVKAHLTKVIDERVGDIAARLVKERALNPNLLRMSDVERIRRDLEEARARRLQPHYVEGFFRDAFEHADGRLVMREAGRWEIPRVPQTIRERQRIAGPLRYERVCFDRSAVRLGGGVTAQLLAPGHPLLDALVEETIDRYGEALTRGTILVDRQDAGDEPRLMVALREEIVDGTDLTVAKRFGYVEMWESGRHRPGAAPFLDYTPLAAEERPLVHNVGAQAWLASATRTAETWATSVDLPAWYAQVSSQRREFVARARDLISDRLKQEISYWEEEISRLVHAPDRGNRGGNNLRGATQEAKRLKARLDRRLTELNAQEHTQVRPPTVVAVAIVIPQGLLDTRAGKVDNVTETRRVELRAMRAVLDAEASLGRAPEAMEQNNPGYDIRSVDSDGHLVHIEVKGRIAGAAEFFVTNREIRVGQNSDHYRLALVEVADDGDQVRYLKNPFADLKVTALVNGVQFKWKDMWDQGVAPF